VLRPLARKAGLAYSRYERDGYSRFVLRDVTYTTSSTRFHAVRFEALAPSVWLWRHLMGPPEASPVTLGIEGWSYDTLPSTPSGGSTYSQALKVGRDVEFLRNWVTLATLSNGTVRLPEFAVRIPAATWRQGTLSADLVLPWRDAKATLEGRAAADFHEYQLQFNAPALELQSSALITTNATGLALLSTNFWWSNRLELKASFDRTGKLPDTASLTAMNFHLPAAALELRGYGALEGSLSAEWREDSFSLDLSVRANPLASASNFPPLQLNVHAGGNTNAVTVETATIVSPWLRAELSRHLNVYFRGPMLRQPAVLRVTADLGLLPWYSLEGVLQGEADFTPAPGKYPAANFHLAGSDVGRAALKARTVSLEGRFLWPWLEVSQAAAVFDDGSRATVKGRFEIEKKEVTAGQFSFSGPLARRWLPQQVGYGGLSVSGTAEGPIEGLTHRGQLEATNVTAPHLHVERLQADWTGIATNVQHLQAVASSGNSSLELAGAMTPSSERLDVQFDKLTLQTDGRPVLELNRPWQLHLTRRKAGGALGIDSSELAWSGPGGRFSGQGDVIWPARGEAKVTIQNFSPGVFSAFTAEPIPEFELHQLDVAANWTNGPMRFTLDVEGTGLLPPIGPRQDAVSLAAPTTPPVPATTGAPDATATAPVSPPITPAAPVATNPPTSVTLKASLSGGPNGIALTDLALTSLTSAVAVAQGKLPLTIDPGGSNFVQFERQQAIEFHVSTHPQAFLWNQLAEATGVLLVNPQFQLDLGGTWERPEGKIDLAAASIHLPTAKYPMPTLENLRLSVLVDRREARLVDSLVLVQRQPVSLSAQLRLGEDFWSRLRQKKLPSFENATARVQLEDAELAAFEPLFPKVLAPQGSMSVDLTLSPGLKLAGELVVEHARTGAVDTTGPIRNIDLRLRLADRTVKLVNATAQVGTSTVSLNGQVDLQGTNWLKGELPPFELTLKGTDVPLAREPDFIIRSDLLLSATKTNGAPPLISGAARLRDSYYLSDLRALVPGKVATPAKRPPYFSVENTPVSDWRLAIDVTGTRFLKVRSPVFNGEVSADLSVQGTLKDPIALGDVKIDSGVVRFPFASLQVQQGIVNLSSANPFQPQIALTANSKQFGYDIRMEITGPAEAPVIQFTSTPPLSSEQILLMVTAGELPQGKYTLTPEQRAQTVALFLGRDLLAKLGFGDQTQQRLTVYSGEEISPQGRPTYRLEYKLSKRWSLEGEYDRFGDFNAGFKWRVFSK